MQIWKVFWLDRYGFTWQMQLAWLAVLVHPEVMQQMILVVTANTTGKR